jgi:uncharacterized protein YbjT (DUF2867 family)
MGREARPVAITGAAGKTGRALVAALGWRGVPVRALVRKENQAAAMRAAGAVEVVIGDMQDAAALDRLLAGAGALYHISPNMHPDEVAIGRAALAALQRAGGMRLVYHSVLHPQTEAMPHHWAKLRVEEAILAASVPFTILQPAAYMQNVLAQRRAIVEEGRYPLPYATSTRLGMVDLLDVAEAAARVLTEAGHDGAIYELAGPDTLTQDAVAAHLAAAVGRPVRAEAVPQAAWEASARAQGLPEYAVRTLWAMFAYYEAHGFGGNPTVLRLLLGRAPTTFATFARREFAAVGA